MHALCQPARPSIGRTGGSCALAQGGETEALARLAEQLSDKGWVAAFEKPKGDPAPFDPKPATTILSPYLKFVCLSARLFYESLQQVRITLLLTSTTLSAPVHAVTEAATSSIPSYQTYRLARGDTYGLLRLMNDRQAFSASVFHLILSKRSQHPSTLCAQDSCQRERGNA